ASWGTVTDFAICDHLTTGTIIGYAKLNTSKTIDNGDTAEFATGAIDVTIG
ncbi:MAG: phage tail fiber protein, partial [Candidatus Thorarchaeota archaeon]